MHYCGAPGMGAQNLFFIHQLNGTYVNGTQIFYNDECENNCQLPTHVRKDMWNMKSLYGCINKWLRIFNMSRWLVSTHQQHILRYITIYSMQYTTNKHIFYAGMSSKSKYLDSG